MKTDLDAYQLANLAEVAIPDHPRSPGAEWLRLVQRCSHDLEVDETAYEDRSDAVVDAINKQAGNLVPISTSAKWVVFTDLAAWQEDLSEWADGSFTNMDQASNLALYNIAQRLLTALASV